VKQQKIRYCWRCRARTPHRRDGLIVFINPVVELILTLLFGRLFVLGLVSPVRWECTVCVPQEDDQGYDSP
jgi:hypothetical protein